MGLEEEIAERRQKWLDWLSSLGRLGKILRKVADECRPSRYILTYHDTTDFDK